MLMGWDTQWRASSWVGNGLLWFVFTVSLLSLLLPFSQWQSWHCSSISFKISSRTSPRVEGTSLCTVRSASLLSISSTDVKSFWTSQRTQLVTWLSPVSSSHSSFFWWLLNPAHQKHFTVVSLESYSPAPFNHQTACNTDIDLLKPDFALLVSTIVTMYRNICSDILILKLVWFPGLKAEFQLSHLVEEISLLHYSSLLSQIACLSCQQAARFSEFVLFTTQFSSSGHSSTTVWVIHAFLLEHQSTRRCLVPICCSLNASARAALPVTRGFNFSPVALQQKRTPNLSLDSLPPLHL